MILQWEQRYKDLNEDNEKHKDEIESLKDLVSQLRSENEFVQMSDKNQEDASILQS